MQFIKVPFTFVCRLKVEGETMFNCAKCSFQAETREDFVKHIVKHKPGMWFTNCGYN